jgi:hypothetical protein
VPAPVWSSPLRSGSATGTVTGGGAEATGAASRAPRRGDRLRVDLAEVSGGAARRGEVGNRDEDRGPRDGP